MSKFAARPAAVAAALVLATCGRADDREPIASTRLPPSLPSRFYPPDGWAWGWIEAPGAPPLRYGVASPATRPKGAVIVLPGYSEPAEKWFETVRDLTGRGWTVWVLDLAGQGGSGRWVPPRSLGHTPDMAVNVRAVRALLDQVVRPRPEDRVLLLGHSLGAQIAVRAAADGAAGVDAVVLSSPTVRLNPDLLPMSEARSQQLTVWAVRLGLGRRFALGQTDWERRKADAPPVTRDPVRGRVQDAWMQANPPLRVWGVSWGWLKAFDDSARIARDPRTLARVRQPVTTIVASDDVYAAPGSGEALCRALPRCRLVRLAGSRHEPHMETDTVRDRWLQALDLALADADGRPALSFAEGRASFPALAARGLED